MHYLAKSNRRWFDIVSNNHFHIKTFLSVERAYKEAILGAHLHVFSIVVVYKKDILIENC